MVRGWQVGHWVADNHQSLPRFPMTQLENCQIGRPSPVINTPCNCPAVNNVNSPTPTDARLNAESWLTPLLSPVTATKWSFHPFYRKPVRLVDNRCEIHHREAADVQRPTAANGVAYIPTLRIALHCIVSTKNRHGTYRSTSSQTGPTRRTLRTCSTQPPPSFDVTPKSDRPTTQEHPRTISHSRVRCIGPCLRIQNVTTPKTTLRHNSSPSTVLNATNLPSTLESSS
ncbi:hypothetical protein BCR34DRAFT_73354 [Clohesyomyces aquaticus]|uniref:Uncharacterized protein n=1 Tax=Clohesyomyces aquaticus TaxID=1231657 RepID=A0A1Y1YYY0_9PLEO|nr:hypothetical protein BCR34DRAFT_73354 [Clohesyomyces aquaticus]